MTTEINFAGTTLTITDETTREIVADHLADHGARLIPRYIVMRARAKMPSSMKYGSGDYMRVAVVETNGVDMPKQINPRHKAVVSVVETWERCFAGKSDRCAFRVALAEAEELAEALNRKQGWGK